MTTRSWPEWAPRRMMVSSDSTATAASPFSSANCARADISLARLRWFARCGSSIDMPAERSSPQSLAGACDASRNASIAGCARSMISAARARHCGLDLPAKDGSSIWFQMTSQSSRVRAPSRAAPVGSIPSMRIARRYPEAAFCAPSGGMSAGRGAGAAVVSCPCGCGCARAVGTALAASATLAVGATPAADTTLAASSAAAAESPAMAVGVVHRACGMRASYER